MTAQPATTQIVSLDEYLDDQKPDGIGGEGFTIETPEQAAWAARKVRKLREQIAEVDSTAKHEAARIAAWAAEAKNPMLSAVDYFEGILTFHHEALRRAGDTRKTLKVGPGVSVKARAQQDEWAFEDAAFIEWAKANAANLLREKWEIDKTAAKESLGVRKDGHAIDESGAVVPGVTVTKRDEKYGVTYK